MPETRTKGTLAEPERKRSASLPADPLSDSLAPDTLSDPLEARERSQSIGGQDRHTWRKEQGIAPPSTLETGSTRGMTATGRKLRGTSGAKSYKDDPTGEEWVVKRGAGYGENVNADIASVREAYASELYGKLSGNEHAPEGKLFHDEEGYHVGSKWVEGFQTWEDLHEEPEYGFMPSMSAKKKEGPSGYDKQGLEHTGLANSLATAKFIGDDDTNTGNIGAVTKDKKREYTKIDFGHAFDSSGFSGKHGEKDKQAVQSMESVDTLHGRYPKELLDPLELDKSLEHIASYSWVDLLELADRYETILLELGDKQGSKIYKRLVQRQIELQKLLSRKGKEEKDPNKN